MPICSLFEVWEGRMWSWKIAWCTWVLYRDFWFWVVSWRQPFWWKSWEKECVHSPWAIYSHNYSIIYRLKWVKFGRILACANWHSPRQSAGTAPVLLWLQRNGKSKALTSVCACGLCWQSCSKGWGMDQNPLFGRVGMGKQTLKHKIQAHQCEVLLVVLGVQPFSFLLLFLSNMLHKANKTELIYTHTQKMLRSKTSFYLRRLCSAEDTVSSSLCNSPTLCFSEHMKPCLYSCDTWGPSKIVSKLGKELKNHIISGPFYLIRISLAEVA